MHTSIFIAQLLRPAPTVVIDVLVCAFAENLSGTLYLEKMNEEPQSGIQKSRQHDEYERRQMRRIMRDKIMVQRNLKRIHEKNAQGEYKHRGIKANVVNSNLIRYGAFASAKQMHNCYAPAIYHQ